MGWHLRPVDLLEKACPVLGLLHPDLLLHAVAELVPAARLPQGVKGLHVVHGDELDLCMTAVPSVSPIPVANVQSCNGT